MLKLSRICGKPDRQKKIIVIGAGLSGLTTAYRLQERGFHVEVYEARNRVGGRVFTINIDGHIGELGGQNILNGGEAKNSIALIDHLGLDTRRKKTILNLHYFFDGKMYNVTPLLKNRQTSPKDLTSQLQALALNAQTMQDVLQGLFNPQDILYKTCSTFLAGYEGAPVEKLSPFYISTLYHILLGGFCTAHPSTGEETFLDIMTVHGGNGLIAEKLAEKLSGRIHLNHPLQEIEKNPAGCYQLTFKNGRHADADILILTIPCPVYKNIAISANVIPDERRLKIESVQNGTTEKILAPILPISSKLGSYTNGRMITLENDDGCLLNMYYMGSHSGFTRATIEEIFRKDLPFVHQIYTTPNLSAPVLAIDQSFGCYHCPVGHSWVNDPFAMGSYSYVGVGQEEAFTSISEIQGEKVKTLFAPLENSLFFAGEHTSVLLDIGGTIEAAVESGERTARMVQLTCQRLEQLQME